MIILKFLIMTAVSSLIVMAGLKTTRKNWQAKAKNLVEPPFDTQNETGDKLSHFQDLYEANKPRNNIDKWGGP